MINIADKSCREIQNTHFIFNIFLPKNTAVYEIIKKYDEFKQATNDYIIRRRKGAICIWMTSVIIEIISPNVKCLFLHS
jgi:hypothetical protein